MLLASSIWMIFSDFSYIEKYQNSDRIKLFAENIRDIRPQNIPKTSLFQEIE